MSASGQVDETVLIVVPTYNEGENIERSLFWIREVQPKAHVLVIDDHSADGTASLVNNWAHHDELVHLLQPESPLGLTAACTAALRWNNQQAYSLILFFPADLPHDPQCLAFGVQLLRTGADVVYAVRPAGAGVVRSAAARAARAALGWLQPAAISGDAWSSGAPVWCGNFMGLRRAVADYLMASADGGASVDAVLRWPQRARAAGFCVQQLTLPYWPRLYGWSRKKGGGAAADAARHGYC